MKSEQETEDGERYERLAFGPNHVVAAAFGTTLQFLDAKRGTVLEQIEVSTSHLAFNTCLQLERKSRAKHPGQGPVSARISLSDNVLHR